MKIVITAGPTFEPIDPVRFIGNRSSGKQGYAIAQALHDAGHDITLISGPTALPDIATTIRVETAKQMLEATQNALTQNDSCDIFISCAAVADWAPKAAPQKLKKESGPPNLTFTKNPDILQTIATHTQRPKLVIGFAAETENLIQNAVQKRERKSCDWILANDVSSNKGEQKVFGADQNHVYLITQDQQEDWQSMSKTAIAQKLVTKIEDFFK